jgi:L-asparaginase II
MTNPVLVEVTRGPLVESRHRVTVAVVDTAGKRRAALGDVDAPAFARSAVKPMQALPLVESGAADRYGFGDAALALACGSHGGEQRHVETAAAMLAAAGRSDADLECGAHPPARREAAEALVRAGLAPTALHNNCSGKHAGFICTACHLGLPVAGYVRAEHPIQREVTAVLASLTGAALGADVCAVDGCSIPTFAVPLAGLAQGFARFATGEGLAPVRAAAARRLAGAMAAEPFMVAGSGRFCTQALELFRARLVIKAGAEGIFGAAFPGLGLGVALKCDDGAARAAETVMAAVIDALLPMSDAERSALAPRLRPPVLSRRGVKVGEVRPVEGFATALRAA